jgi:predicted GIY-YIG superfamily endonuclease
MPKRDDESKARLSGDAWFVYLVRCADGSLYTGIAKDVARRCEQNNDGTTSKYTRTRRPVGLVYQEPHPSQSSALKREAAIKAMDRREKLAVAQQKKKPSKGVRTAARLEDVPNVGPAVAADLRQLGIATPAGLPGRDPYALYDELCRITGRRHDPRLLDTFIAAVRYMEGAPKRPWWTYTAERKRVTAARRDVGGYTGTHDAELVRDLRERPGGPHGEVPVPAVRVVVRGRRLPEVPAPAGRAVRRPPSPERRRRGRTG